MKKIIFFATSAHGEGISGGDRIFIELAKRWLKENKVKFYLQSEGLRMCQRQRLNLKKNQIILINNDVARFSFWIRYIWTILICCYHALIFKNDNVDIIFSASEFWMDSFPCFLIKLKYPKIKWIAAWYQTAPSPFKGFAEGDRANKYFADAFIYWLIQLPVKPLISFAADYILVNNENERKFFPQQAKRLITILGAVNLNQIQAFKEAHKYKSKIYDAVFQGRFHPQKGVVELVDIWKIVVNEKPKARLAMIGDGPLMGDVRLRIRELEIDKNIDLLGYVFDGDTKYQIFSQSKIVVHPSYFDSGGMASAEAMAFGLPCVGFNLESFKSYYPQGMEKVEINNKKQFANVILKLLNSSKQRSKLGKEALEMIKKSWSWDKRAQEILNKIQ